MNDVQLIQEVCNILKWLLYSSHHKIFYCVHFRFMFTTINQCESGSSVGIATVYGLDGPGSNPGGDEIFRLSRPGLGPTQPPVKWVPGLSRGKVRPGRAADHSPPSSVEQYSYTSTHPLGHTGPVTGSLYPLPSTNKTETN